MQFDYKVVKAKHQPAKETILFIHGYAVDYSYFVFIEDKFPEYDLYFVNLPGHGPKLKVSNDKKEMKEKLRIEYMANYVVEFIKEMNLNNIILVGHSMGGAVVSMVENKCRERIKKLILISPMNYASLYTGITFLTKFFPKTKEQKMKLLSYLYKDFKPKDDPDWIKMNEDQLNNQLEQWDQMKFLGKKEMASLKTLMKVHKAQKNIKIPFMLCLGTDDGCIPYKHTKRNFNKHHKDKMHLVTFDKSGHLCFEEETDKFVKEIKAFIEKK